MAKYRVFKGEEEELEPDSFFVIRRQDVVGAQALYGYAHLLQSLVEADTLYGFMDPLERDRVIGTADVVFEIAGSWASASKKVPD